MSNDQQLPQGMGGIAPASAPQLPSGGNVVTMPNPTPGITPQQYQQQFVQPNQQVPANQAPPPAPVYQNPMLTTLQPLAAPPAPGTTPPAQQPAQPPLVPPVVPEPPKADDAPSKVTDLAGALGSDPMIAPAVAYLEAAATKAGLDVQRAFGNAADELDARFIDRAYLVEKVGQAEADQMIKVAESSIKYAAQVHTNLLNECRAVAGDQGTWDQAVALFNQHADAGTKAAISAMFDSMNRDQMIYASRQLVAFAKQTGGVVQSVQQPLGAPGTAQGLSSEAYRAELAKLPRNAPDSAYDNLRNQRAAGIKAGLQ